MQTCPKCKRLKKIPYFLTKCYDCAYLGFKRAYWTDLKPGDIVYLAGNESYPRTVHANGIVSLGNGMRPKAYGPHIVHDPINYKIKSGNNGKIFTNPIDDLLIKKER